MHRGKFAVAVAVLGLVLPLNAVGDGNDVGEPAERRSELHVLNALAVETPTVSTPRAKAYALFCKSVVAELANNFKEARALVEEALKLDPNSFVLHQKLAEYCAKNNDQKGYFAHTRKMVEIEPDNLDGHWGLGLYYEATRQPKEAAAEFEKAIRCKTDDPTQANVIRFKLAEIERGLGNPKRAIELCEQVQKSKPAEGLNHAAELLMGQCYLGMKDYAEAISRFKQCIVRDIEGQNPTTLMAYQGLTEAYMAQDKYSDAIGFLNVAVKLAPSNFEFMRLMATVYEKSNRTDEAIKTYGAYSAAFPKLVGPSFLLAGFYEKAGRTEDAIATYSKIVGVKEPDGREQNLRLLSFVNLANIYARQNKSSEAIGLMQKAVAMVPEQNWTAKPAQDLLLRLVFLYDQSGRSEEAEALLKKMLLADSNNAQANNYLGYFYADRGVNLDLAIRLVSQALSVEPLNGAYLDSLGWALFKKAKAGDSLSMEDILRKLQRAAELDRKESGGEDPVILDHIAVVCLCLGRWEEAKEKWEASLARAEELAKDRPNALPNIQQVRLLLAWVTHALDQEGRSRRLRLPISKRAAAQKSSSR